MNKFSDRKLIIGVLFVCVALIFIIKLFYIQIIDDSYKLSAENNSQRQVTQFPARGSIYDRNGNLLVDNQAAFDLMVIPRQVKNIDTTDFCNILGISKEFYKKQFYKCKKYSRYKASPFLKQVTRETYAILQEKLYKFSGFFVQTRTLRKYANNSSAHVLGYVGEVNNNDLKKYKYYKSGDYIGKSGIEYTYEKILRGKKGLKIYLKDVHNRIQGSYKHGRYNVKPEIGKNLTTTLDIELQQYAEKLMQNKKGGIVAIEPSTGEILVKISSPGYDPKLLVGNKRGKNYGILDKDTLKPLFDRAMMGRYPPGSIFKLIQALIGLQEKVITPKTKIECHHGYRAGRFKMRCHDHESPLDLKHSIEQSCNAYYATTFRSILENHKYKNARESYTNWRKDVLSFGFGDKLGVDIPYEKRGSIPKPTYFDKVHRTKNWKALNIISLAIGQGELLITPLQMANMVATIANRGYYIPPHVVKSIDGGPIDKKFKEKHYTKIDKKYFDPVIEGMEMVITGEHGTGKKAIIDSIAVCGKTGTVQNTHGDDHSVFVAFAPKDNPKIALVVYVENGVWGSRYAAPISGLLIEKYLKDKISEKNKRKEKSMMEADLITKKKKK